VCRAAQGHWSEEYERYVDPNGKPFYWLTGRFVNEEAEANDTDEYWLGQGYISVVPVNIDQTDVSRIDEMTAIYTK
jgi:5'-nucleotidase